MYSQHKKDISIKSDKSIKGGIPLESQLIGTHNN